ncbi:MAG: hypothetical protein ACRCSP_06690 [Rhodoglobus sp.]
MSTLRTPVGPQPSTVYWRRRIVVALGLIAVVVLVILLVVRPGAVTPTPALSTGSIGSSSTMVVTPQPVSTDLADTVACDPASITVTPEVDQDSYEAGVNPVLSFSLTSSMRTPCTLSAGSDVQEFVVSSGKDRIWSSKDCQVDPVAATATLLPGVPLLGSSVTWARVRSSTGACGGEQPVVSADGATYRLSVAVGAVSSSSSTAFLLY